MNAGDLRALIRDKWFWVGIGIVVAYPVVFGVGAGIGSMAGKQRAGEAMADLKAAESRLAEESAQVTRLRQANAIRDREPKVETPPPRKLTPLNLTIDQILEPIAVEFAIGKHGDGRRLIEIAGGKVMLGAVDDEGQITTVNLMADIGQARELARSFFLLLARLEPEVKQGETLGRWFADSFLFAAKQPDASVHRTFYDHEVVIVYMEIATSERVKMVVVSISAAKR